MTPLSRRELLLAAGAAACGAPARGSGRAPDGAGAGVPGGAMPFIEQTDLFPPEAAGGYAAYRIPGIVVTGRGSVLAYCEARRTGGGDWGAIDLLIRRSVDGGRTWGPARRIGEVPGPKRKNPVAQAQRLGRPDEVTYNNPVAIAGPGPTVHFLFCLEYQRCFALRSDDDGETWGALASPAARPVEITAAFEAFRPEYDWKVLATGPGHGIRLESGRLVVPVWLSTGTGGHAHRPSVASVLYSDDGGETWRRGAIAVPNTEEWINPSEAVALELADGRVMLNARSESKAHRRLVTFSRDGATGWSRPEFHEQLPEPICMASMVRLSRTPGDDRNRILFANPDTLAPRGPAGAQERTSERRPGPAQPGGAPPVAPGTPRARRNVSVKLSYDEGRTWPVSRTLEPGPSGYSDLAVLPDGTILCLYERGAGGASGGNAAPGARPGTRLTLARFNLEWLTGGRDTLRRR